jgi:hypothetical protein
VERNIQNSYIMACEETQLDVQVGSWPQNFKGTSQEWANKLAELLIVTFPDDVSTFVVSNVEPASNKGPWLNTSVEPSEWYVWSDVQGKYIPLGLDQSRLGYQISETAPDPTKFKIWFEVDSTNCLENIKTYDGSDWCTKIVNEDRLEEVSPKGIISMWSGGAGTIPAKYRLCAAPFAGTTVNGVLIPNLADRFIVGAGNDFSIGDTGGAKDQTISVANLPTGITVDIGSSGAHRHQLNRGSAATGNFVFDQTQSSGDAFTVINQFTETDGAHTHQGSFLGANDDPLDKPFYYALAFIIFVDQV